MKALDRSSLRRYAERTRPAYEGCLRRLVEIPSVSADPARRVDVAAGAAELVRDLGGRVRLVKTGGHPLLVGEFPGASAITLYNHLDVQPADREAEGWRTEPFRLVKGGGRYYGRGTTDDKGPALAALFGAAAAHEAGAPVTVKLLWETEEEIGSPNFERTLAGMGRRVATDAVVISGGS